MSVDRYAGHPLTLWGHDRSRVYPVLDRAMAHLHVHETWLAAACIFTSVRQLQGGEWWTISAVVRRVQDGDAGYPCRNLRIWVPIDESRTDIEIGYHVSDDPIAAEPAP